MKKIVLLLIILLLSMSLFAKWSIGQVVDDFDDPTGEEFIYTITEGTFANSATTNSKACIRVSAEFSANPYPEETWTFEIHDYNWDNPINDYYDDSSATIKIKDSNEKVTTFTKSNSEIAHTWNTLKENDGYKFTQLLKDNDSLKVSIAIENSRYVFTIDSSDFNEVFDKAVSEIKPKIGFWEFNELQDSQIPLYEQLKDYDKSRGIQRYYPIGSYEYYEEQQIGSEWYLYYFNIDNDDLLTNNYMSIAFYLYRLDKSSTKPTITKIESDQVKRIYLFAGNEQKKMKTPLTLATWSCSESTQKIVDKMALNKSSGIKVVLKNGQSLTFNFDGTEFAKIYEKAKNIELF